MDKDQFIWPLSIRIIHWLLALVIVMDAFIFVEGDDPHQFLGYFGVFLVMWRTYFGFRGKGHVLFKNFPISLNSLEVFRKNYLKKEHVYEGHNPLASIVYILMWLCVIVLGVTGWMMGLDAFWGNQQIEEVHEVTSNVLLGLTVFHLIGILLDAFIHKRKTWMKMIRGT